MQRTGQGQKMRGGAPYKEKGGGLVPLRYLMKEYDIDRETAEKLLGEMQAECGSQFITWDLYWWWCVHVEELNSYGEAEDNSLYGFDCPYLSQ